MLLKNALGTVGLLLMIAGAGCSATEGQERDSGVQREALCSSPGDEYDAYPLPDSAYAIGPASAALPWQHLGLDGTTYTGEQFEDYLASNATLVTIETSPGDPAPPHIDVTSGALKAKLVSPAHERGWVDNNVTRVLMIGNEPASGKKIGWTNQVAEYRANVSSRTGSDYKDGIKLFARYQTEDDLYAAGFRFGKSPTDPSNATLVIQRKKNIGGTCDYVTLGSPLSLGTSLQVSEWYTLRLAVRSCTVSDPCGAQTAANELVFSVSLGSTVLGTVTAYDTAADRIAWGTSGIRTDYVQAYVDDWKLVY
jgi:hypothetical protein